MLFILQFYFQNQNEFFAVTLFLPFDLADWTMTVVFYLSWMVNIIIPESFCCAYCFPDFKKRRIVESSKSIQEHEPSGLDALASAAVLGENLIDTAESSAGVTTKHPRHRPGCSCIVCIQPPSGKGRHKPTCTCNVCMTVKRRFKTLMLRKKKRQSEREADTAQKDQTLLKDEPDTNGAPRDDTSRLEKEVGLNKSQHQVGESSTGQIDLNSHPNREDMQVETTGLNMSSHLEPATNHTVGEFMDKNDLRRSFNNEVQTGQNSSLHTPPQSSGEGQRYFSDGRCFASIVWNQERKDEVHSQPNQSQNNLS